MPDSSPPPRPAAIPQIESCCEAIRLDIDAIDYLRRETIDVGVTSEISHLMALCESDARANLDSLSELIKSMN